MYQCFSSRRIGFFLSLAAVAAAIWLVLHTIGSAVAAPEHPREGVFLPVIMYHSITQPANDYQLSPETFERDLQYLTQHGYESVSVAELVAYTKGEGDLPEHPVLLTFDDGFYNNLSDALPLLEKYGMCAVISIVGRYTDEIAPADPGVPAYSYLTWEDVQTLLDSGRIEIGSHTWDLHANRQRAGCSIMLGEDPDDYAAMLREDLTQLQTRATEMTGCTPDIFAYPFGFICRESIPVLQEQGFVCALTCREEPNYITRDTACLYGLGRYHRSPEDSTETFFARALAP